jgi:hypothetical protein
VGGEVVSGLILYNRELFATALTALTSILENHSGYLAAHPDRIVGAPVLRIDLGSVGQVQVLDGGPVVGYTIAVIDADDGLGAIHFVMIVLQNPGAIELRVDLL